MGKKLGDTWVEVIDGKEHLLKAVEGNDCRGCCFASMGHIGKAIFFKCARAGEDCAFYEEFHCVVKDLGILKDGVLPCNHCGEYPVIKYRDDIGVWYIDYYNAKGCNVGSEWSNETKERLIEVWNDRI